MQLLFWGSIALVIYTYVGYGVLLYFLVRLKRLFVKPAPIDDTFVTDVTVVVAAYNEEAWIADKVKNCLEFDYPREHLHLLFVTDGSNDRTPQVIADYPKPAGANIELYHRDERKGKIAAVNRIMPFIDSPVVIYTDANTVVNKEAVRNIVRHFADPKVGAVAGEKRISLGDRAEASGAGEGIYWKYESALKRWDSELYSVVGAAGELFAIRRSLFEHISEDTIVEDFLTTMRIAQQGYKVVYEPNACAAETSSASVGEELKRKIRIAAGGMQAIVRLAPVLNIFKYGTLSFQYISHRVLRWTLAPLAMILVFFLNIFLLNEGSIYQFMMIAQVAFYFFAALGYILETRQMKVKAFFVPYYFCMMNYAVFRGFFRFLAGRQSVLWERAQRAA